MKIQSTLVTVLILLCNSVFGQLDTVLFNQLQNPENLGKCLVSYPLDKENEKVFYLQVIPPEFVVKTIWINEDYVLEYHTKKDMVARDYVIIPVSEKYLYTKFEKKASNCMSEYEFEAGKSFCFTEVPVRYEAVEYDVLIENGDTTILFPTKIVSYKIVAQDTQIKIYSSKEEVDNELPVFEIKGGKWTDWKDINCSWEWDDREVLIIDLERRLKKLGYDITVDEVFDDETREALVDFQKKNNLPLGILSESTLVRLFNDEKY